MCCAYLVCNLHNDVVTLKKKSLHNLELNVLCLNKMLPS